MVRKTIFRISLVKMLYSKPSRIRRGTPNPFVEIRAFIFSKTKPTFREEMLYKKGLEAVINNTENLFSSIVEAKKQDALDDSEWKDLETEPVSTEYPATPRVEMEIDGYEIEEVDIDEVSDWFAKNNIPDKLEFDSIYRYVAFFNPDGTIEYEYGEPEIEGIEAIS